MQTFDERSEKNIKTLHPRAQEKAREFMQAVVPIMDRRGVDVRIISGTRTYAEQDALFAKRPKVTNARGGFSNHNFGVAWDIGLFQGKRYLEESPLYRECGRIGQSLGLEWGGSWKSIQDEPHFEVKTGLTIAEKRERVASGRDLFS
jgi:peptidoglycan L-alanyl-D-glutamate endopeptidase CwlK